jgi:hypothetical protein
MKIRLAGFISSLTIAFAAPTFATPLPATSGSTEAFDFNSNLNIDGVGLLNGPTTTSFVDNEIGSAFAST